MFKQTELSEKHNPPSRRGGQSGDRTGKLPHSQPETSLKPDTIQEEFMDQTMI